MKKGILIPLVIVGLLAGVIAAASQRDSFLASLVNPASSTSSTSSPPTTPAQQLNPFDRFLQDLKNFFEKRPSAEPETSEPAPSQEKPYSSITEHESAVIAAIDRASPAVVSIVISKKVPIVEQYFSSPFDENLIPPEFRDLFGFQFQVPQQRIKGYEEQKVGGGSGFFVSSDGLIVTNKHVVEDKDATYTVFLNDGRKFEGKVSAIHPTDDLALIKVSAANMPFLKLGDSRAVRLGQTAIAIGNALGEYANTASAGIISGLRRTITAQDNSGKTERLENMIQTDAAINPGNSGGPLLNLQGEVIGVNTAIVSSAQSIGFAIPANRAAAMIQAVKTKGKITVPFLGVRYVLVTDEIAKKRDLPFTYGALIIAGEKGELGVSRGSAAEKAGLKEGDVILEFNKKKITLQNTLAAQISESSTGEAVTLTIFRDGKTFDLSVTLGERE